jgi:capsular polysaccharide biosynthesis protein
MELREFLLLLKKNATLILLAGLVLGGIVWFSSLQLQPAYHAVLSIYVQKIPEQPSSGDFTYDGFYAQQAAESYTDTVVGLFESPALHARALQIAEKPSDSLAVKQFEKQLRVEKVAPRLIDIELRSSTSEEARLYSLSLFQAVKERLEDLTSQDSADLNMRIDSVNQEPLISLVKPLVLLNTVVGVLVGLFAATSFILLKQYLLSVRQ